MNRFVPPGVLWALFALMGNSSSAFSAALQAEAESDSWGSPVDGVQMRIALDTAGQQALPGELPAIAVQIRNLGSVAVAMRPEAIRFAKIEVDGVWYDQPILITGTAAVVVIASGTQKDLGSIRPDTSFMYSMDVTPAHRLELRPGPHRIRIRNAMELSVPDPDLMAGKSGSNLRVPADRSLPALVSNSLAFDIAALSPGDERAVLAEQASAGGREGIPAAQRMVQKYPDAALPVIEKAVAVTTNAAMREQYLELVRVIPGDHAITFLLAQIVPAVDLGSRLRATEVLLARGRADGLWSLLDTVERIDRDRPWLGETARLLEFLGRTGNPRVIDALGRMSAHRVDVRMGIVWLFLPPSAGGRTLLLDGNPWASIPGTRPGMMRDLPGGAQGAEAVERLLGNALEDIGEVPMQGEFAGVIFHRPRVCDMAALVLSLRWPERYRFTWADPAERDRQIAVIRTAWKSE